MFFQHLPSPLRQRTVVLPFLKTRLLLLLLLPAVNSFSQTLNYCDYFSVKFSEVAYEGQKYKSCEPVIFEKRHDKASQFFKEHHNRFEYILFKHIDDYKALGDYFPDSIRIQQAFCETVLHSATIQDYFSCLTPKDIVGWKAEQETFTVNELMLVASRFFYCDYISTEDTTVQSHTCIGIHGQRELKSTRDYTLLEAFSGEAVFHYLGKRKEPLFYQQFVLFKNTASKENLNAFTDFDTYLATIRQLCYDKMQQNEDLKKQLLKYYSRNRDNLNFEIVLPAITSPNE